MLITTMLAAVLLYPEAVRTEKNLLNPEGWSTSGQKSGHTWERRKGGPFSEDEPAWHTYSSIPISSYWVQSVSLEKGHRYLVGMWMRRENSRVLIWCYAKQKNGRPFDQRLYLFGGFNECLVPYIRPRLQEKIGGDPAAWKLMYRPLDIDAEFAHGLMTVSLGIYMSTGSLTFSHPFLIDITGKTALPLRAEQVDDKPIRRVAVSEAGVRDVVWERTFDTPPKSFAMTFDGTDMADGLRAFNPKANKLEGHFMQVDYADGSSETVWAPQENVFQVY